MNNQENNLEYPKSYWIESVHLRKYPSLEENYEADVTIVGGGMTGITAAYLLANEGLQVAVLESGRLLNGTTGHTTAKITAQHGLIYDELISNLGEEKARAYYDANAQAMDFIKNVINERKIDCGWTEEDAILYATTEEYEKKLENEMMAYERLGIQGEFMHRIPLNLKIKNAIKLGKQAQFHPLKYLSSLILSIEEKGGRIFEETTAVKVEKNSRLEVHTRNGKKVMSDYVLICSHFPFYEGMGLYSARMHVDRSYILAAKVKRPFPGGMYLSADHPTHSLRSVKMNGEEIVLIGGEGHRTGKESETKKRYQALHDFGNNLFGIESVLCQWSAQDLTTLDKIPYVGEITSGEHHILIATGYRKWGMTNSTAAAKLLRDKVLGLENRFEKLFTPSRFPLKPSLKAAAQVGGGIVSELIKGKLETSDVQPETLGNDEGAIIMIQGERKGAYRDADGQLHIVDTTCTHMGCEVNWNDGERTWDCPCHGSRYSYTGEVVEGPAEKPLQKYDYKMIDSYISDDSGY